MDYYLLSDQDLDEILWDIENILLEIKERIKEKNIGKVEGD
ncbi:MAG: hypothetical protein SGI74_13970 [Oligoflexia bacterium]|nr:hypothetical protein [Oligoflexia bacterium]